MVPRNLLIMRENLNLARLPIPPRGLDNQRITTETSGTPSFVSRLCILQQFFRRNQPSICQEKALWQAESWIKI
jgi:hypothetical protein